MKIKIDSTDSGRRIDVFLNENLEEFTRSYLQKCIENGHVTVNSKTVSKNYKLVGGDEIELSVPQPKELDAVPQEIEVDIVYEDDDVVVVNKPKGMVVHPAPGNSDGTLVNALLYHCGGSLSGIGGVIRPGIVHRIDKNTSGILVVAKNDTAHLSLSHQMKEHSINRIYFGVVHGSIKEDSFTIDRPIGRSSSDRKKMSTTAKKSKEAVTHVTVIDRFRDFTLCKFQLETGRTHQIRVHLASIGHPLAGDDVYGVKKVKKSLNGQCLHAKTLGFSHPRTGEYVEFSAQLPDYFNKFINTLQKI